MTAVCRPEQPRFASEAERQVWERLRGTLPAGSTLVANQNLTDENFDHEADLVVLLPDEGVLVLEVKGGAVSYDGTVWRQRRGGEEHAVSPAEQARRAKYALRDYVEADPRWSRGRVGWAHGVVTPHAEFPADFTAPECPRWALHDREDQYDLAERVRENARRGRHSAGPPTADDLALLVEVLQGRGTTAYDLNAEAAERRAEADRLTAEQAGLLQATRLLHRVEVRGGAGSGKTMLALAQARELSRGRHDTAPQRVALLCYSIGLGQFLRREVESWPKGTRAAFVGTFHDLGRRWGAPEGDRQDSEFWEEQLPALMVDLAAELPEHEKYDAILVDEAQDFAESWWVPLLRALKDPEQGGVYVYSDENQRIFARYGQPPVPLVPLVLDHNLRNTRQIHQSFGPLAPTRMTSRGGDGVDVQFVPTEDDPVGIADDALELLADAGWAPGNIALLTTGHRHNVQVELTQSRGQVGYWRTYWEDDVFYGHVLGCKGLERPAVVLCVNDERLRERAREKLYVGMSRATDQLVVVGEPGMVREMGGPDVAERLGI